MMRRTSVLGIFAVVAVATAACTGSPNPSPTGDSSSNTAPAQPTATTLPFAGAPKVANPLPASVLSGDPCKDALTPSQITDAAGSNPKMRQGNTPGVGADCSWSNTDTLGQVYVGYDTESHTGLSGLYKNTQPKSGVWKELPPIQGFPAVAAAGSKGTTPKDHCVVTVGLTDDLAVDVGATLGSTKIGTVDPCEVATGIADQVVTTLRAKAGA